MTIAADEHITLLDLEELLHELRYRNWTLFRWGERHLPFLVAATYRRSHYADVLILRDVHDASAYRIPAEAHDDRIWNPRYVSYQYHSTALWTLRAILTIPPPTDQPRPLETAAEQCSIPDDLPSPLIIRPL